MASEPGGAGVEDISLSGPARRTVPVLLTRWVFLISLAYALILSAEGPAPSLFQQIFIAGILVSNLVLGWALRRGKRWEEISGWVTASDIGAVTLAIGVAGNVSTQFYLIYFSVLILAAVVDRLMVLVPLAVLTCLTYLTLLFLEMGPMAWRSPQLLVRVPVLFGVAVYFGTAVQHARREYGRQQRRLHLERGHALKALSEMGRLVQAPRYPGEVLHEITGWTQRIMEVDRCSVIIFGHDKRKAFLAATGDDPRVEVLALEVGEYPELEPALETGEITEIHPGDPPELWERMGDHIPVNSPFRTFLVVPIKRGDSVLGVLYFRDAEPGHRFSDDHINFCEQAAQMIASFIHEHDLLEQIQSLQRHDSLTGLLTYQVFMDQTAKIMSESNPTELSLAMVDIDNLRDVNKEWGHGTGNHVIASVGHRLNESLQDAEAICRYTGDDFLALIRAPLSVTQSRLQRAFLDQLEGDGADLPTEPRASVGIAGFPPHGDDPESVVASAELALRQAKAEGGHRIRVSA